MRFLWYLLLLGGIDASGAGVGLRFDERGLSSLRFDGTEFLSNGHPEVEGAAFALGPASAGPAEPACRPPVAASEGAVLQTCRWLSVRTVYTAAGDRLLMTILVTNTSPYSLERIVLRPLELKFPVRPAEHNGRDPVMGHGFWAPTILTFHYGTGTLAVVDEDVEKPLTVGLPWALDAPRATVYPLKINTGRNPMYPASFPRIERPIAPRSSDTFRLSLRFQGPGATAEQLAGDIYRRFAAAHPPKLAWPDRRPVAALFLATAGTGFAGNPRGWFNEPNLQVHIAGGRAEFRRRLLGYAATSAGILRETNAQGMITWDLEGQEDPQATYVGNPSLLPAVAPEMNEFADEYFRVFTSAGLRVGLTLRMQRAVRSASGKVTHSAAPDPVEHLAGMVDYAKQRWGATLFYVDSNDAYDAEVFRQVLARHPGVLLIPEHKSLLHYAYTAPYEDVRISRPATPADVLRVYPEAFSAINFVDSPTLDRRGAAARAGDVLLFPGWYRHEMNPRVKSMYRARRATRARGAQLPIAR